jgi:hypothetical protein
MVDIRNVFSDNRVLSAADLSALLAFTACASRLCDRGVTFPHRRSDLLKAAESPTLTAKGDVSRWRKQVRVFPLFGEWRRPFALNCGRRRPFAARKQRIRRQAKSIANE